MSLTIAQTYADLLSKLGIESTVGVSSLVQQDCVVAINGAMQILQTAGEEYFTRETITLTLAAGTAAYVIPATVQAVVGPARLNNDVPLKALTSRGEYDQFDRIFLGDTDYGAAAGTPIAYWPESIRSGSAGDIVRTTIYLAPAPSAAGTLVVEVINDAPSYTTSNLADTTVLPVAQAYTESIFLPIARWLVTRSSQFSRPDLMSQLQSDYQRAMATLGMAGGFPLAGQPEPRATQD